MEEDMTDHGATTPGTPDERQIHRIAVVVLRLLMLAIVANQALDLFWLVWDALFYAVLGGSSSSSGIAYASSLLAGLATLTAVTALAGFVFVKSHPIAGWVIRWMPERWLNARPAGTRG